MTKYWYVPAITFFMAIIFSGCMKPTLEEEVTKYLNKDTLWINSSAIALSDQFESTMILLATKPKEALDLLKTKQIPQSESYLKKLQSLSLHNDKLKDAHLQIIHCAKYTDLGYKFVVKSLETNKELYHKQAQETFDKADQSQRIWKQRLLDLGQKLKVEIKN
ncbi:MAG: hypothetical protein KC646_04350 [Candidatus Cloacimonetes bacterium]|nr:hypothetical protein [Candidatus Cloacimonadota bacterium]